MDDFTQESNSLDICFTCSELKIPIFFTDMEHNRNNESDLIDYLLRRYNRQARPIRDLSKPVNVSIGLNIGKMLEMVS